MINIASMPPGSKMKKIMHYCLHNFFKNHNSAPYTVGAFFKVLLFDVNLIGSNLAYMD